MKIRKDGIPGRNHTAERVRFGDLWISAMLFAGDMVPLVSLNSDLLLTLRQFAAEREEAEMMIAWISAG